jgi:hypothetical protein
MTTTYGLTYTYDMRSQILSADIDKNSGDFWNGSYTYHKNGDMDYRTIQGVQTNFTYVGKSLAETWSQDLRRGRGR